MTSEREVRGEGREQQDYLVEYRSTSRRFARSRGKQSIGSGTSERCR